MCQEFSIYLADLQVIDLSLVRNPFNVEPWISRNEIWFRYEGFFQEHYIKEFFIIYLLLQLANVSQASLKKSLGVEHDVRCALYTTVPKIDTLVSAPSTTISLAAKLMYVRDTAGNCCFYFWHDGHDSRAVFIFINKRKV